MRINRCMGCMAETESYPCPRCGYRGQQNPDFALPCGSILNGQYLLGRMLGQGGFGITYIGWDLTLNVKIAIKEYYPRNQVNRTCRTGLSLLWNNSEQAREWKKTGLRSVLQEAQKMARIDNLPQTVRVRNYFEENNTAYIVMDFVEGETLQHKLRREGPMSWKQAKEIFIPVITAMECVHAAGILHRDISPDNLMLAPDGRLRILDLGAAKDMTAAANASDALAEASSQLVVKNGFSPIEQYGARRGMGTWTDVYAMAATIYYTLTGKVPPIAGDRAAQDTLRFDASELAGVPAHARAALKKALAVKPGERTQTMGQLLKQLEEPVKQEPKPWKKIAIIAAACAAAVCAVVLLVRSNTEPQATASTVRTLAVATVETLAPTTEETTTETTGAPTTEATTVPETTEAPTEASTEAPAETAPLVKEIVAIDGGGYENDSDTNPSAGYTVILYSDGTVDAIGDNSYGQCNTQGWENIVQISTMGQFTLGLKADGTVVMTGRDDNGIKAEVESWTNITMVSAGVWHAVGLRSDGTVVAAGKNTKTQCDVDGDEWSDIVAVAAMSENTIGLKSDGTAIAQGAYHQKEGRTIGGLTNLTSLEGAFGFLVGLHSDGDAVSIFGNTASECREVEDWQNIRQLVCGREFTAGLTEDGRVLITGALKEEEKEKVESWTDIKLLGSGLFFLIGVKEDGTLVSAGRLESGQNEWSKLSGY